MTLTINLSDKHETALKAKAEAKGVSEASFIEQILEEVLEPDVTLAGESKGTASGTVQPSLSARIRQIWADMSEEERAQYPAGGAYQIDHHVYGLPRG